MRVYPVVEKNGEIVAFEVENLLVGIRQIARILGAEPQVTVVRVRRLFAREGAPLVRFALAGESFIVDEPFGDNSRYWIGPENPETFSGSAGALAHAFEAYSPPVWRSTLATILTPFTR
jgi:hypothetical protein